jgi:tRNA 2-selenouridine synthase
MVFLEVDYMERLKNILNDYGSLDRSLLGGAIVRLQKKMGGLETKTCLEFLLNKDYESCFGILLKYYDKLYLKSLTHKKDGLKNFFVVPVSGSEQENLQKIYNTIRNIEWT